MWIELHDTLSEHRKTEALAQALGVNQAWAVGILAALWTWSIRNAPTGDLSGVSDKAIARACFWERGAGRLVDALTRCGWLDPDRRLHHWQDYAGRLLARRAANAQRMRDYRARTESPPCGATVPNPPVPHPTVPNPTPPDSHKLLFPDQAWRTSARARAAVAQRVVDRLLEQGCSGTQLHQLVEEYLALGLAPEKLIGFSALNEGELSARFFGLLKGGKP